MTILSCFLFIVPDTKPILYTIWMNPLREWAHMSQGKELIRKKWKIVSHDVAFIPNTKLSSYFPSFELI